MKLKKTKNKYPSGQISYEYYLNTKSQMHGPFIHFYSNGQKYVESSLILNQGIGVWKRYYSDGRRRWIDTRNNGILNGTRIEFK